MAGRVKDRQWWMLGIGLILCFETGIGLATSPPAHQSYRLGVNDLVHIQVYGEEDLNIESKIDGDGSIHFPLLGPLHVAGKTIQELQDDLTARLARGYVRMPKVTAYIVRHRNFYVSGEVKNPGGYPYEEGLTVHKALSVAGGRTEKAQKGLLRLTRVTGGTVETTAVTPETTVLPDDIIVVEAENYNFYASGEVKTPGGYPYKDGLTVHKALAMAGGLTEKAEREAFQVLRQIDGREETLPVELDGLLLPDDIIVVTEGRRIYVSGEVKTPGRYLYEKGMAVHKAVSLAGGRTEKAERGPLKLTRIAGGVAETLAVTPETTVLPDDIIVVEADNYKFYASGEVKTPGGYPYKDGLTVHKALAMAGGLTEKAERGAFQVLRQVNGHEATVAVGLESLVLPDDIIVVAEGQRVYVSVS